MKSHTTLTYIGGSWYVRIPPAFVQHLELSKEDRKKLVDAEIQDEESKHGKYCSFWKK
jgi:hypothetical protein